MTMGGIALFVLVAAAGADVGGLLERMYDALGGRERVASVRNLSVRARCTGPGGEFTTEVVSLPPHRALMRQRSPRGTSELVVIGEAGWQVDSRTRAVTALAPFHREIVRGHEFHLLVFELERRFSKLALDGASTVGDRPCFRLTLRDGAGRPASICLAEDGGLPLRLTMKPDPEGAPIVIDFADWREIDGVRYFHAFELVQGDERFTYDYFSIEPDAVDATRFDEVELLGLHQQVLQAHLADDVEGWMATEAEDYVSANRGEILRPTKAERESRIRPYLESTEFVEYRDLVPPLVKVSRDGTLGWVVAQVGVVGERTRADGSKDPIDAVWAWIELYEKRDGRWLRTGNVSNERPPAP